MKDEDEIHFDTAQIAEVIAWTPRLEAARIARLSKIIEPIPEKEPGWWVDDRGASYDGYGSWLEDRVFKLCGCGNPTSVLDLTLSVLSTLEQIRIAQDAKDTELTDALWRHWKEILPTENERYVFSYAFLSTLDEREWIEHGSSVHSPWLTDLGHEVLRCLRRWKEDSSDRRMMQT